MKMNLVLETGQCFRILPSKAYSVWSVNFLSTIAEVAARGAASSPTLFCDGLLHDGLWPRGLFWVVLYITVLARRPDHTPLVIEAFQTWLRCTPGTPDRVASLQDLCLISGQSTNNVQNRQVLHMYHSGDMRRMRRWLGMIPLNIPWAASYRLADTPPGPGSVMEEDCRLLMTHTHPRTGERDATATSLYLGSLLPSECQAKPRPCWFPLSWSTMINTVVSEYGAQRVALDTKAGCPYSYHTDTSGRYALVQIRHGGLYATDMARGVLQVRFLNSLWALGLALRETGRRLHTGLGPVMMSPLTEVLAANFGPVPNEGQHDILKLVATGRHRLLIMSGAAGTGKTTLCRRILLLLARLVYGHGQRGAALVLAPTTAALQRLRTVLNPFPVKGPRLEFRTVDWILTKSTHNAESCRRSLKPIVLVDECGLLSATMWTKLNGVLSQGAVKHVCYAGDDGQLPPIEWTQHLHPLAELTHSAFVRVDPGVGCTRCACTTSSGHQRVGCLVSFGRLSQVMRSLSGISELGAAIRGGSFADVEICLTTSPDSITWVRDTGDYMGVLRPPVFTLSHHGALGTIRLNDLLQRRFGSPGVVGVVGPTAGDPIVATQNTATYYNGQRGVVLARTSDAVTMSCDHHHAGEVNVPLADVRLAYCSTIHSAQGAEFDSGTVIIDARHDNMCCREALYTAVTRFRTSLVICCSSEEMRKCLGRSCRGRPDDAQDGYSVVVDDFIVNHTMKPCPVSEPGDGT